jgi:hypothetical protein
VLILYVPDLKVAVYLLNSPSPYAIFPHEAINMPYLLKTEPTVYSFARLQHDKATLWDGVTNPTAVKNLREMTPGTKLII